MAERRRGSLSAAESVISTEPLSSPLLPPTATASNNNIEQDQQFFPVQNDSALLYSPGSQSPGSPSSSFTLQVGRTVATVVLGQVRSLIAEAVLQSSTSSSSARTSSSPEYLEILCILLRKLTNGLGGYSNLETPSTIDDRWVMALMECAQVRDD